MIRGLLVASGAGATVPDGLDGLLDARRDCGKRAANAGRDAVADLGALAGQHG